MDAQHIPITPSQVSGCLGNHCKIQRIYIGLSRMPVANEAFGGDNEAFGGDNEAFGGDNEAFGGDNEAFGGDNRKYTPLIWVSPKKICI